MKSFAVAAEKSPPDVAGVKAPPTVLVVDEEALVRWSVKERLTRDGYRVLEAATADAALAHMRETVDVVLLRDALDESAPPFDVDDIAALVESAIAMRRAS